MTPIWTVAKKITEHGQGSSDSYWAVAPVGAWGFGPFPPCFLLESEAEAYLTKLCENPGHHRSEYKVVSLDLDIFTETDLTPKK